MVNTQSTASSQMTKQLLESEEREELALYLFKTHARNKMLAFKRILSNEFPLRMLPLDFLETLQDEDGFDLIVHTPTTLSSESSRTGSRHSSKKRDNREATKPLSKAIYILCFVSMVQIEAYLKAHDLLKGADSHANQHDFSQLSKSIMTNSKYLRD